MPPGFIETRFAGQVAGLRAALGLRSDHCLLLQAELVPIGGEANLVQTLIHLVNQLAPAVGGGLSAADFATFVGRMSAAPSGATAAQQLALARELGPMVPAQILDVVTTLASGAAGALPGSQIVTLVHNLRSGGQPTTGGRVREIVTALCGAAVAGRINPTELREIVEAVHPNGAHSGDRVRKTIVSLVRGVAADVITPEQLLALVRQFRAGANALNGTQIGALVDSFMSPARPVAPATAKQFRELFDHLLGAVAPLTPVEAHDTVIRLRQHLSPASVHGVAYTETTVHHFGQARVPPVFIRDMSLRAHGGQEFDELLQGCIAAANLRDTAIITRALHAYAYPVANICTLLAQLPSVPAADKGHAWKEFLTGAHNAAAGNLTNNVIVHLERFFTDGHVFGDARLLPDVFGGGALEWEYFASRRLVFKAIDQHVNYICNVHTYRHLNFEDRRVRGVPISMFPAAYDYRQVADLLYDVLNANQAGARALAARVNRGYGTDNFLFRGTTYEIGVTCYWVAGGTHVARVDHFMPTNNTISNAAIVAIAKLFVP